MSGIETANIAFGIGWVWSVQGDEPNFVLKGWMDVPAPRAGVMRGCEFFTVCRCETCKRLGWKIPTGGFDPDAKERK